MKKSSETRHKRHCVFMMHVHLVFIAKYRKMQFNRSHLETMRIAFEIVCESCGAELVEFNGEPDHVHLLINYPPTVSVSKLVNSLKGVSSRRLRQANQEMQYHYRKHAIWSPSYFAGSCGGTTIAVVRKYIEKEQTAV